MSLTPEHLRRLARVARARDWGFVDLVSLAELDPATAFRGAILRGDMRGQNLAGFDFTGAEFRGCDLGGADLSGAVGVTPEMSEHARTDETTILPRALFWARARAPSWAEDWGLDTFGPWVTFRIPGTDVTQRMRWCPPGEFMMGSPDDEAGRNPAEGPRHRVVLDRGFLMFDTACTEALWSAVMNTAPRHPLGPDYPVTEVSWDDARDFVQRLNAKLSDLSVDLPSEARWEYACRAGSDSAYNFSTRVRKTRVRYDGDRPVEAGSLPANKWALFEMHGNVWEWCLDHWRDNYEGAATDGAAWLDARGRTGLVVRGGSWRDRARDVRVACRYYYNSRDRYVFVGFRCARVQSDSEAEPRAGRSKPSERAATTRPRRRGKS